MSRAFNYVLPGLFLAIVKLFLICYSLYEGDDAADTAKPREEIL